MALTDNVIAHWKMNEASGDRADSSGNGYALGDGVPTIGSTAGKIGDAAHLIVDTEANFFRRTLSAGRDECPVTAYTAAGWIRYTAAFPATNQFVDVMTIRDMTNFKWIVDCEIALDADTNYHAHAYSTDADGVEHHIQHTQALTQNVWYYVATRWNGSTLGISVNASSFITTPQTSIYPKASYGEFSYFESAARDNVNTLADVDSVTYWLRSLSDSEISQMYNNDNGLDWPFVVAGATSLVFSSPARRAMRSLIVR